jgi:pantoate--beta-alanine ligase
LKIIHHRDELPRYENLTLALVPTMGAFHEGHLDLMRLAKRSADKVIVSLFVNPTQFGPTEDFDKYPRQLEWDAEMARSVGVDFLYVPDTKEVYPRESTRLEVPEVTTHYEGAVRPGHFAGVATIVAKLLLSIRPQVAIFGQKDLQQCAVIQRLVEDLCIPVDLTFAPTTRESDGLAMSSRNQYLSEEERKIAPKLYQELRRAEETLSATSSPEQIQTALKVGRENLESAGFKVDYFDLIDRNNFAPTDKIGDTCALVVAARLVSTRLIDNVIFTTV